MLKYVFDEYPEVFPVEMPDVLSNLAKREFSGAVTHAYDKMILDEDLAYPIKLKGFYYINVPSYVRYLFKIIQPFLSKKLKERMVLMGTGERFETLHNIVSPELLPKFLGGVHENEAAFELVHTTN
ncbi:Clavesin-2 [Orchesella cincta]|uniref:Clavesin-2 n=1 Tax=Orchesella cincta TaxID=48709 RepID=A0A1D2M4E7_ORCCI|nr:Clavesin-2 [Orchesella cincta]